MGRRIRLAAAALAAAALGPSAALAAAGALRLRLGDPSGLPALALGLAGALLSGYASAAAQPDGGIRARIAVYAAALASLLLALLALRSALPSPPRPLQLLAR
jgi:hypothetical protein